MNTSPNISAEELRLVPAFEHLPTMQIERLAKVMMRRNYAPGQLIFLEGEDARGLWFVFKGRVKIIKQSLSGRVQGLCMMTPGKCFGSCPLYDMEKNPATAQAVEDVTLFILPEAQLEIIQQNDSDLISALLHIYSQRLSHLAKISEVLATWTVQDRINDCLITYASKTNGDVVVKLTHEKLAALSGTVREVVTRHLAQLEKQGIVLIQPGLIKLLDQSALMPPCQLD